MYNKNILATELRSGIVYKLIASTLRTTMGTITSVDTKENVAALTFDDGPHPEYTPRLLDILEKHHVKATFFMLGKSASRFPELVRQVAQQGHTIGNHTWDHRSLLGIKANQRRAQIRACAEAIAPYGSRIFRPPYGYQSLASRLDIFAMHYQVITWSIHANDWVERDGTQIADTLINNVQPGSIILLHDGVSQLTGEAELDRGPTIKGVELLLDRLGDQLRFVTVSDLLKMGLPRKQNWYRKKT